MTREKIGEKIIELAYYYEGLHETKQNSEWDNLSTPGIDPAAQQLKDALKRCGWQEGWPYCYTGDVEILTESGWVKFSELTPGHGKVAQVSDDCLVSFAEPIAYIRKLYSGRMARIKQRGMDLHVDEFHQLFGRWNRSRQAKLGHIKDFTTSVEVPAVKSSNSRRQHSQEEIRFIAAFLADGFYRKRHGKRYIEFGASRPKKLAALAAMGARSTYTEGRAHGPTTKQPKSFFKFDIPSYFSDIFENYKEVRWDWIFSLSAEECKEFIQEYAFWDGCRRLSGGAWSITTSRQQNADALAAIATLGGLVIRCQETKNTGGFNKGGRSFALPFCPTKRSRTIKKNDLSFYDAESIELFCVQVPEGKIVIREPQGSVLVCGNCAAWVESIWKQAYTSLGAPMELLVKITTRCSPSVMRTFKAWNSEINMVPQPGAIFFMQFSQTDRGHAGIVIHANETQFATIEANTSPMPSSAMADREGDGIFRKVRQLNFQQRQGLWLRGFLNPIEF